jgi:hypothetical protein
MMQGMMGDGTAGAMMWGMGLFGVFVIIVRTREVHLFRPVNESTPAAVDSTPPSIISSTLPPRLNV